MMWYPIHSINLNLLQVKGRSDLFLRLEIIKKCLGVAMICVTVPFGIVAMCWGSVVNSIIALIINTHYTGKLIQVGFLRQMRDLCTDTPLLILDGCGSLGYRAVGSRQYAETLPPAYCPASCTS